MNSEENALSTRLALSWAWLLPEDLGASMCDWIVPLMLGDLNTYSLLSCQNIETTISFIIHVLCSYQCTYSGIILNLLQFLSILSLVVVETNQVVSGTSMILLASIEIVSLDSNHLLLLYFWTLHIFEPFDFSVESLFSQVSMFCHIVLILLLANFCVCHGEVLIKSLLFWDEVRRCWVWVMDFSTVDEFVVTACSLPQSCLLNSLFIFHRSLK